MKCEYRDFVDAAEGGVSKLICRVSGKSGAAAPDLHCDPTKRQLCAKLFARAQINHIKRGTVSPDLQFPDLREFHGDLEAFRIDKSEIESQ